MEDINNTESPLIQEPINQNEKKTGIGFYIISIIVILFLSLACYVLAFKQEYVFKLINKKKNNNSILQISQKINSTNTVFQQITPNEATIKRLKGLSPKETYLILKEEENKLTTFDDFLVFARKYSSKATIAEFEEALKNDSSSSASMELIKQLTEEYLKYESVNIKDITNIQEKRDGNKTILDISTNNQKQKGTVIFVLEDGIWKLEKELWEEEL